MSTAPEITETMVAREARLKEILAGYGSLLIAYSGGVDSAYLADVAHEVLGDRVLLALVDAPTLPRAEYAAATALAESKGWPLIVLPGIEMDDPAFLANDPLRCYVCKRARFEALVELAAGRDLAAVVHGENADDHRDTTRVGARAAIELGVKAPLEGAELTKADIRALSARRGLPTWNRPATACLATRIPTGTAIDAAALAQIEAAERVLHERGYGQCRVRHHGALCRIEVEPDAFSRLSAAEERVAIADALTALGYRHVTLDLAGYRMGSTAAPPP